jgi:hypothetical protein
VDDLAVEYWVPYQTVMKNVRELDRYRHDFTTFPSLPDCVLEHGFSIFTEHPFFSAANKLVTHRHSRSTSPEMRGNILVVKYLKSALAPVVDIVEADIALVDLIVTWYVLPAKKDSR